MNVIVYIICTKNQIKINIIEIEVVSISYQNIL